MIAALGGFLLSLAFPPVGFWPVSLVALAPLLWLARDARPRRGFLLGLVFGLAFFGTTLYWIALFGELAWFSLTLVLALFVALFSGLLPLVWRFRRPGWSAVAAAAAWVVVVEWVRATVPLGGFGWGSLAAPQVDGPLLPIASIVGSWGIAFVVALVNGLVVATIDALTWDRHPVRPIVALAVAVGLLVVPVAVPSAPEDGDPLEVAAIQVDVRSAEQLDRVGEDRAIARLHTDLHRTLAVDPPDLVVWGESSLDPGAVDEATLAQVREAVVDVAAPTLVSTTQPGASGGLERQANLLDATGEQVDSYSKVRLVPFGEYVPFRGALDWVTALRQIPYDLTPGTRVHALRGAGLPPLGVSICFENTFERVQRELVADGAEVLVVTTNNASYEDTAASAQHVQMSRLRAVETGRPLVHAAISGIGAVVDANGAVMDRIGLFEPGVLRSTVTTGDHRTPYVRFGYLGPWLFLALVITAIALPRRRRREWPEPVRLADRPRTLVVLPTYDERDTIGTVIEELLSLPEHVELLVIDDSSPDGTGELVRVRAGTEPRVHLLERPGKAGLASAYLEGFRTALEEGYDLIVEMDSDLSHQPEELHGLLADADTHDLVIGSRYVSGGSVTNWSRTRVALSRMGNLYARLALGLPVRDATSGFRVYRRALLAELLSRPITSEGYGFQIELALRSWALGASVGEAPISFREREHGHSKISRRIVVEALWLVAVWGFRARLRGDPLLADRPLGDAKQGTGTSA
ncbi:MAG: apolipoprotein N-acyltransferase [Actinomycetota bacterium]